MKNILIFIALSMLPLYGHAMLSRALIRTSALLRLSNQPSLTQKGHFYATTSQESISSSEKNSELPAESVTTEQELQELPDVVEETCYRQKGVRQYSEISRYDSSREDGFNIVGCTISKGKISDFWVISKE